MKDELPSPTNIVLLSEGELTQKCVVCKQDIPKGALLCSICKSHQSKWKNHLQFFAGATGIVTLILFLISGAAWLTTNIRKTLWFTDDIQIISASSPGSAVIVNRGDGEVFISHLIFSMLERQTWKLPRLVFEEKLPAGQFLRKEFQEKLKGDSLLIRHLSTTDFEKLIDRAVGGDPCLTLAFYVNSDSFLREMIQTAGPGLNTFKIGGYLEY